MLQPPRLAPLETRFRGRPSAAGSSPALTENLAVTVLNLIAHIIHRRIHRAMLEGALIVLHVSRLSPVRIAAFHLRADTSRLNTSTNCFADPLSLFSFHVSGLQHRRAQVSVGNCAFGLSQHYLFDLGRK
jgi:hypothetical protein